ncbi:hypothetical protein EDB83DRAFT_2514184 [Lactarius deliciosus]|nr:hypothetical protein EDB83DRAFT_2514184 [Lactarius deliciosus]
MSVATPTDPPSPAAVPGRPMGRLVLRRDFVQEMDDLSEEEAELEDNTLEVKNRGLWLPGADREDVDAARREERRAWLVSQSQCSTFSRRVMTGEGDGDGDGDVTADGEDEGEEDEDGGMDLDAEIEDMDDDLANTTAETEDFDDVDDIDASVLDE